MVKKLVAGILSGAIFMSGAVAFSAAAEGANPAPTVLPAIREWNGGNGKFIPDKETVLVAPADSSAVEKVQGYFREILSMEVEIVSQGNENAVVFQKDESLLETVGEEGYTLDATENKILIKAPTETGLLYGGITVCQSLYADGYFPVGQAVDYPSYPIRSGMLDVGRAWIPLEYVEEISRYMVWFKMNEIHLHINDEGSNGYSAFRLESDVKGLTAKDGYYTKDEYRAYQKRMLEYGMTVVTEVDTPFHSRCYQSAENPPPHLPGNDRCLDISKPETLEFVKNLLAEYMTGDDPVFVGKVVHIGTDEYPREYAEDMRKYTDALIKYVDSLGYIPRHWGSMGPEGFPGETPVAQIGQVNFWDVGISGPQQTMASNYDVINTVNNILYTVPTTNYNFPDYFNLQYMYQNWQVNVFNYSTDYKIDPNDPQLKGACFALWNDLHTAYKGVTRYDIFDRLRGMVCLTAEKTWLGMETKNRTAEDFMARYDALSLLAGDADPGRHTYPEEGIDLQYPEGLALGGTDLTFGIPALGFPNTLEFELSLDEIPDAPLFAGDGVEIWADADGKGHIGFKNEVYTFTYDYTVPVGEKVKLRFSCDGKTTLLTVNDTLCFEPVNGLNLNDTKLSTLTIPLERVLQDVKGTLYSLRVTPAYESVARMVAGRNLALNASVSVSKLEVEDGRFTADMAVDGTEDTRLSFSAKEDEQWLLVDLGDVYDITRVEICYNERVAEYDIQVSEDGENFTTVYTLTGGEERKQETDVILLETSAKGRYVRYRQHKRWFHAEWNTYYSGGIREFRVFSVGLTAYEETIAQAYKMLEELDGTDPRRSAIRKAVNALKEYITSGKTVYIGNADLLSRAVVEAMNADLPEETPGDVSGEESLPQESTPAESVPTPAPEPAKKSFPWWIPVGGAAVLGAVAAVILLLRKKKS